MKGETCLEKTNKSILIPIAISLLLFNICLTVVDSPFVSRLIAYIQGDQLTVSVVQNVEEVADTVRDLRHIDNMAAAKIIADNCK